MEVAGAGMSFVNRGVLNRVREASKKPSAPPSTTAVPMIKHPHCALEPGKTWLPHDGKRARERRLRQQRQLELKRLRKKFGSSVVSGVGPDGALHLDFPAPARAKDIG